MRSLRAENMKSTADIARLTEKNTEAQRKLDIASASEAALKTQLKSAEATIRGLKDDISRTKALVTQTRTSCATEVRRRDRQIDTLKKQVTEAGRARGSRTNSAITTITVTGDVGTRKETPESTDLEPGSTAFLTNLARKLSEENEAVLMVMQRAMEQLQEMSGWQSDERADAQVKQHSGLEELTFELDSVMDYMRTLLNNPSFVPLEEVTMREEEITRLKDGWVKMESRWKDAVHLIDGWRKRMSTNGQPLSDEDFRMGLKLSPIRVRNIHDTNDASDFRLESVSELPEMEDVEDTSRRSSQGSLHLVPAPEDHIMTESDSDTSSLAEDEPMQDEKDQAAESAVEEPMEDVRQPSPPSSPLPEPPQMSPLRNSKSAGNRGTAGAKKPLQRSTIPTAAEERPRRAAAATASSTIRSRITRPSRIPSQNAPKAEPSKPTVRAQTKPAVAEASTSRIEKPVSKASVSQAETQPAPEQEPVKVDAPAAAPTPIVSRRPAPTKSLSRPQEPAPQQSPLTMTNIAAKLAASEREADAARVRAKLKAARLRKSSAPAAVAQEAHPEPEEQDRRVSNIENMDPVREEVPTMEESQPKPGKRKREQKQSMRASRRRSTLSPWELETLMAGQA